MNLNYFLIDVFTEKAFGGNQLAVFPDAEGISDRLMQNIANELHLSETTFVLPPQNAENDCHVRIFTPTTELPMAGHPTIGTAFVLLHQRLLKPQHANYFIFEEGVGDIKVDFHIKGNFPEMITMNQPLPTFGTIYENITQLAAMLSIDVEQIDDAYPAQIVSCGFPTLIVPISDLNAIKEIKLRLDAWEKCIIDRDKQQVFVFTTETEKKNSTVHCRFFAPALGILEDPATGAASGPLGSYLVKYGIVENQESSHIISEQGYEIGRPSIINIEIGSKDDQVVSVKVGGKCVFMGEGKFVITK